MERERRGKVKGKGEMGTGEMETGEMGTGNGEGRGRRGSEIKGGRGRVRGREIYFVKPRGIDAPVDYYSLTACN